MFCSKCGKAIDDDSKFCPFCGHTLADSSGDGKAPGAQGVMGGRRKKKKAAPTIFAACAAAAVVLLVVTCIFVFRTARGGPIEKSFLGRMFSLSWSEISDMSARDFRDMMKEEDIRYKYEEDSYPPLWSLTTEETVEFMGGNAIYGVFLDLMLAYREAFIIQYEAQDECEESYEEMKSYLDRNLVRNTTAVDLLSPAAVYCGLGEDVNIDGIKETLYVVEECTDEEELAEYLEKVKSIYEDDEQVDDILERLDEYAMYKMVNLLYAVLDDDMADSLKDLGVDNASYSNSVCIVTTDYKLVNRSELTSEFALMGWDSLTGKEVDVDKVKSSLDGGLQPSVDRVIDEEAAKIARRLGRERGSDEEREVAETGIYSALYMLDKHDYDVFSYQYLDEMDKNIWYVTNFEYDMDKGAKVDLSRYMDSSKVYCAVEYNYDTDASEKFASDLDREIYLASKGYDAASKSAIDLSGYMNSVNIYCTVNYNYNIDASSFFENDLDRILYLVNLGYNPETGGIFGSRDEKRLWVMANYGYDIVAEKAVDKEVGKALMAYQEYEPESGYDLLYLDDDDIPECISWGSTPYVMSYAKGIIQAYFHDDYFCFRYFIYIPKEGKVEISDGGNACNVTEILELKNGIFSTLLTAKYWSGWYDDNTWYAEYEINGETVDFDTYSNSLSEYGPDSNSSSLLFSGQEHYASILEAYDALRTVDYFVNMPEIDKFELSDGILTVSTNDGKYGWNASNPFSINCPVAEDCIWEQGHYEADFVKDKDTSYEELKEAITSELDWYESIYEENGPDWFQQYGIEGPMGIQIDVRDEVVVRVRVSGS